MTLNKCILLKTIDETSVCTRSRVNESPYRWYKISNNISDYNQSQLVTTKCPLTSRLLPPWKIRTLEFQMNFERILKNIDLIMSPLYKSWVETLNLAWWEIPNAKWRFEVRSWVFHDHIDNNHWRDLDQIPRGDIQMKWG